MSSHVRQILIAGAGTAAWWNAGDEAILSAMLRELRAQFPGVEIGVLSANPRGALDVYQVQEIPVSDIDTLIEFARRSDLLVLGGGGLFYDYWGFAVENLLTESQGGAGLYIGFALLATLLNKPLMMYAVGVGPLFSDKGKHYTRLAFEQAHDITVRDSESKELLISLGISPEKIRVTADPVWGFPEIPLDTGESLIQQMGLNASSPLLGVSLRPWTNPGSEEWEPEVARALDGFIEEHGGTILFIPFHKNDGKVDDYAQSEKVRGLMKYAASAHILDADLSLEKKVSLLRRCDLVLGMRLHANILAMRYGIPAVGLAYDPKVTNLFKEAGKPAHALDLRVLNAESLQFVLSQAWGERDVLRTFYAQVAESMSALAKENVARAGRLARNNPPSASPLPADTFEWVKSLLLDHALRTNERIVSLTQQATEQQAQIDFLNMQIDSIKRSFAWKITLPIRFLGMFFQNPLVASVQFARYVWARLPDSFRAKSQPWVQRWKRRTSVFFQKSRGKIPDLNWEEFQAKILSKRDRYKGVFIQEYIIDWGVPLYQRPQHIATALGRLGYLVIYKTPGAVDIVHGFREVAKNVWVTNDFTEEIKGAVLSLYSTAYGIADQIVENGVHGNETFVYEYIDHVSSMISGGDENVRKLIRLKRFAFQKADFVVASARQLEQEAVKELGRDKVVYIPNGVDVHHYRDPLHRETELPEALTDFRKKYQTLVGYFGAIAPWLWYPMLEELVKLRPEIGFVFIGPDYQGGVSHLPKTPNLLYLGPVDYNLLPAYGRLFDVCLIPFAPGEIARTTSPLKLFEYFALEKPVVVTSFMDECVAYSEVFSGDSAHSISSAIDAAVKVKDEPGFKARLALLADRNSWDERARAYETIFSMRAQGSADYSNPEYPLSHVQYLIVNCYKQDGKERTYYETAYSKQEYFYWQPVLDWIIEMPSISSLIDIGAAYGTLMVFCALNKKTKILHAVDPVGYMSKSLVEKFGIVLHAMDFEREPFEYEGKFDLVIFTEVIEHLNFQPDTTLQKIRRLMHEDSRLIVSTPDASEWGRTTKYYPRLEDIPRFEGQSTPWIDDHIWQYEKEELDEIFARNGFQIEKFAYAPGVSKRHLCYLLKLA